MKTQMGGNAEGMAHSALDINVGAVLGLSPKNTYAFECHGPDGDLRWREEVHNLITTEGKNDLLTNYFKGSSYSAAFYVGLVTGASPTFAAGDTAAQIGGANGWTESTIYSESVRQTLTLGTASSGSIDNTASKAVFSINNSGTIGGGFVITNSTKSGTTGKLYGEAAFGSARTVANTDTISVSVTLTV